MVAKLRSVSFITLSLVMVLLAACGKPQGRGEITGAAIADAVVADSLARQQDAVMEMGKANQILFGDLHVHTTFSPDAFIMSVPLMGGTGLHPPADACDFARYCSSLDFWSINDHAEGITPRRWAETRQSIRECNQIAGDRENVRLFVVIHDWQLTAFTHVTGIRKALTHHVYQFRAAIHEQALVAIRRKAHVSGS